MRQKQQQIQQFEQRLKAETAQATDLRWAFGIVVNPRTGEPFLCCSDSIGRSLGFQIRRFDGSREGSGSFEEFDDAVCFIPALRSNHPRVHVAGGVVRKGSGNGTCLYVCSAVAAYVSSESGTMDIQYEPDGARLDPSAVCSAHYVHSPDGDCDRSSSASEWWNRAVKNGLAKREKNQDFEPREIDECLDSHQSKKLLNLFVDDVSSVSDVGDSDVSVCATGSYEFISELEIETLSLERAQELNLVVAYTTTPPMIRWQDGMLGVVAPDGAPRGRVAQDQWDYFNPEAARAVNVGVFRDFARGDEIFEAWVRFCSRNGVDDQGVGQLRARFQGGIDLVPEARANPARSARAATPKRYGKSRRNPSESPVILANELLEERTRLGWNRLASLP